MNKRDTTAQGAGNVRRQMDQLRATHVELQHARLARATEATEAEAISAAERRVAEVAEDWRGHPTHCSSRFIPSGPVCRSTRLTDRYSIHAWFARCGEKKKTRCMVGGETETYSLTPYSKVSVQAAFVDTVGRMRIERTERMEGMVA